MAGPNWWNTGAGKMQIAQMQQQQQNPWNQFQSPWASNAFGSAVGAMADMGVANANAGATLGSSQNKLTGDIYGWNTQANMKALEEQFNRQNTLDTLANALQQSRIGLQGTQYTADRRLDEAKQAAGAQRYGAELGLKGTQYGADTSRAIASEQNQFGRANTLDQLAMQQYLGNLSSGTERYSTDVGANTARYGADTNRLIAGEQTDAQRLDTMAELLGLKYSTDKGLEGLGIQGDTARDVARIEAESDRLPDLLKMIRFQKLLTILAPMLGQFGNMQTPPQFQPQAG